MDLLNVWSIRIAEASIPEEIDLAPIITQAFTQGGEARERLFRYRKINVEGAFGPGEIIAIFPWVLRGIAASSQWLFQVLSSENVGRFITVVKDSLEIKEKLSPKQNLKALPDDPYEPLKQVIDVMSFELQMSGLSIDQADLVTFRVVRALLEEPSSAVLFIRQLENPK